MNQYRLRRFQFVLLMAAIFMAGLETGRFSVRPGFVWAYTISIAGYISLMFFIMLALHLGHKRDEQELRQLMREMERHQKEEHDV